jgi:chemotaxis signal transduction protein
LAEPLEPDAQPVEQAGSPVRVPTRTLDAAAMERLLSHIAQGTDPSEGRTGTEYLLFTCRQTPCAAPLHDLREVLPSLPRSVTLPFSPPWLLGIFPLRTELVGLVDLAAILLGALTAEQATLASLPTTALIVGEGEVLLGLAVTSVGAIAQAHRDELTPADPANGKPLPEKYVRAFYAAASGGPAYAVLDLPRLAVDLIGALTEGGTHG